MWVSLRRIFMKYYTVVYILDTFASYIEAAKRAINIARNACLIKHAKDGIFYWLNYTKVKEG